MSKTAGEFLQDQSESLVRVAINERGYRIGETHQRARIPDSVIAQIRNLHEDLGIGYRRLAKHFNLKRAFIQKVCKYRIRAQVATHWRKARNGKAK